MDKIDDAFLSNKNGSINPSSMQNNTLSSDRKIKKMIYPTELFKRKQVLQNKRNMSHSSSTRKLMNSFS